LGTIEWARLKAAVDVPLRRGGWYRVVSLTRFEAVVSVQGQAVSALRPYVETPATPPPGVDRPPSRDRHAAHARSRPLPHRGDEL
jgi:hypothetical protein